MLLLTRSSALLMALWKTIQAIRKSMDGIFLEKVNDYMEIQGWCYISDFLKAYNSETMIVRPHVGRAKIHLRRIHLSKFFSCLFIIFELNLILSWGQICIISVLHPIPSDFLQMDHPVHWSDKKCYQLNQKLLKGTNLK